MNKKLITLSINNKKSRGLRIDPSRTLILKGKRTDSVTFKISSKKLSPIRERKKKTNQSATTPKKVKV